MKMLSFLNSYTSGKSGGDIAFIEFSKRLNHIPNIIVTSRLGTLLCKQMNLNSEFIVTSEEHEFSNVILTYFKRIFLALKKIKQFDDITHIYSSSDFLTDVIPAIYSKILNKKNKPKLIQKIFHLIPTKRIIPFISQRISFLLIKCFCDVVITDSNSVKDELVKLNFNVDKLKVNNPGIDLNKLDNIKSSNNQIHATFMGRLFPAKGAYDLIFISREIVKEVLDFKLIIIGTGPHNVTQKLNNQIAEFKLENNVILKGFLPDDEAYSLIKSSKLFIFPSHEEGFGIVILEALSLGIPVVAYDLPAYRSAFKNLISTIKCFNKEEFSLKVIELIKNENKRLILSEIGKKDSRKYSWDNYATREEAFIKELFK